MTIWNLGSINVDHVYQVPQFVTPGETLMAMGYSWGLGGKGLNQSVACLRSGGDVRHLGAIGAGDAATARALEDLGLSAVWQVEAPTGHAMIQINAAGENCIVLAPGANRAIGGAAVKSALAEAKTGDWLLLQNETSAGLAAVQAAKAQGLRVCYAAAPFEAAAVAQIIDMVDLLSVNEVELQQLQAVMTVSCDLLVTLGAKGAFYQGQGRTAVDAFQVEPVDTTGAGDTFLGAFLARLDEGAPLATCLRWASAAGALQVTRLGAAQVIPDAEEIELFLTEART